MTQRQRKILLVSLLLALFVSVAIADFRHTEKTCKPDPNCPACQFQSSSLTVSTIDFFVPPALPFFAYLESTRVQDEVDSALVSRTSRAPPQA
ncbi:MAG: hypothetical protein PHI34_06290 [Acidobacteriota bacterium]|nr:hypothetical protein [Acidobacteriota bacterium]